MLSPVDDELDRRIRLAAFEHLRRLVEIHGGIVPWKELRFELDGATIPLVAQQGIVKPAVLDAALTILTAAHDPYGDEVGEDGFLRYRYQGTNPMRWDNVALRRAFERGLPLVYLHGVEKGWYRPVWPVFIHGDDPAALTFTVAVDDPQHLRPDLDPGTVDEARRAYVTRVVLQRLHQDKFRHRVIAAYRTSCAVCRLRHGELLDAAHILPDGHPNGLPVVPNGLALCKIHHAAYDRNILGVRPDAVVEIRVDVLEEVDGPMLRHGLQDTHGTKLHLPRRVADRPKPEFLEERYELFRAAS